MTAPPSLPRTESSSRKSRRSRSPEIRDVVTPGSARRRSEDRDSVILKKKVEFATPSYLRLTVPEIEGKHLTLQEQDVVRIRESTSPESEWYIESDLAVRLRNRYINIQPWAKNRIHLSVPANKCDYINASPILLRSRIDNRPHHYIATQGPKENQTSHFWRMVWTSTGNPGVVIMLTQCWEAGRDKCHQYFPEGAADPTIILKADEFDDDFSGDLTLLTSTYDEGSRSTVRQIRLTVGEKSKIVWHFLYSVWPDFDVPGGQDRVALQSLLALSAQKTALVLPSSSSSSSSSGPPSFLPLNIAQNPPTPSTPSTPPPISPINPRIIHCSAGVGRSGTFIALDFLLSELSDGSLRELGAETSPIDASADPVFDTVQELRRQRMMMVQSDTQMVFLYQTLRQAWNERYLGKV
ncbi:MAG: hypothetical protein M1814_000512 [Vezdaea aestivalis]|nr:MAG: hypothetical protein M1814_000512 [Vezdaea aestivalis]